MKWPMVALHDICRPKQWPTISSTELKNHGYPVYGANGKIGHYDKYTHEQSTILITCRGATCGTINVCEPFSYVNGNAMALDDLDERVSLGFLAHYLRVRGLGDSISGSAQPQITRESLRGVEIPLPPLEVQRRIATILDKSDDLRRKRRAALQKLDSLAQSLFLDMFGDPVANPRGWPRVPFSDLLQSIESGNSPVCLDRPATLDEWGVLKLGAVTKCAFNDREQKALPQAARIQHELEVKSGDLLFSRKNTRDLVAACALVRQTRPRLLIPDLIFRFVLRSDAPVEKEFLHQLLILPPKRKVIQKLAGGSAGSMPNISKHNLSKVEIELPPIVLQKQFVARVNFIQDLTNRLRNSAQANEVVFSALQHRAFRGEL